MGISELAGKPAPRNLLVNVPRLVSAYFTHQPDPSHPSERVAFGTSGHRGNSLDDSFNEDQVLAICQSIVEYRQKQNFDGPLYIGMDTHALSEPAMQTAIEVFAANGVNLVIQSGFGYTPTPVISHAILTHNRGRTTGLADGVVITPSHNPPEDGGFKYNPPSGGPADTDTTKIIQARANELLESGVSGIRRTQFERAMQAENVHKQDYVGPYVADLKNVLNMQAIADSDVRIGVDPMGGSAIGYWEPIADTYGLKLEVVNQIIDPTFAFMTVDHDGKIRMDCSSPYAMARLIDLKDRYDIAFGNDPDADRHGIVTPSAGLMNPNHYLAVAIWYLFQNRPEWSPDAKVGKTLVSSSMIDRVAQSIGREVVETPVGFKWFVEGLLSGDFGFAGEESAGAAFVRKDGSVWTTDKDGLILGLLAAEITAVVGEDPGAIYRSLEAEFGSPVYERIDVPATAAQKEALTKMTPELVKAESLGGDKITAKLSHAPGNNAPIGGLKIVTNNGWFAARPSGTEDVYKIYAESFKGIGHLHKLQEEAQSIVNAAFREAGIR